MVKNLPAVQEIQETWVRSLDWEDPHEEGMTIHSSILAWEISWTEEPGGLYSPWGPKKLGMTERLSVLVCVCTRAHAHTHTTKHESVPNGQFHYSIWEALWCST